MSISFPTTDPTYVGAVLDTYEQNLAHDSYFHAVVWDGEKVTTVETHSTAYGGPWPTITLDATDDVIAAATEWYRARVIDEMILDAEDEARTVKIGNSVRSITTRGKNKGVTGIVGFVGPNAYSRDANATRVRVQVDGTDEQRWLDGTRVEVIDPAPIHLTEIIQRALRTRPHNWRSALYAGVSSKTFARVA